MVTVISGGSHSGRDKVFIDKIKSAKKRRAGHGHNTRSVFF